jgi:hypothetical protein
MYMLSYNSTLYSNLFWSREYNSAKEICKYPSFSKEGGDYPLDLKIIWSSNNILRKREFIIGTSMFKHVKFSKETVFVHLLEVNYVAQVTLFQFGSINKWHWFEIDFSHINTCYKWRKQPKSIKVIVYIRHIFYGKV